MPFVVRIWGYDHKRQGDPRVLCYLNKDGMPVEDRRLAKEYDNEAEAWEHARLSGNTGEDEDGPYCWVEEA